MGAAQYAEDILLASLPTKRISGSKGGKSNYSEFRNRIMYSDKTGVLRIASLLILSTGTGI
jgi:hypothetical protein